MDDIENEVYIRTEEIEKMLSEIKKDNDKKEDNSKNEI